jgi:hypothetical protein
VSPLDLEAPGERVDGHDRLDRDQPPTVETRRPDDECLGTAAAWVDDDRVDTCATPRAESDLETLGVIDPVPENLVLALEHPSVRAKRPHLNPLSGRTALEDPLPRFSDVQTSNARAVPSTPCERIEEEGDATDGERCERPVEEWGRVREGHVVGARANGNRLEIAVDCLRMDRSAVERCVPTREWRHTRHQACVPRARELSCVIACGDGAPGRRHQRVGSGEPVDPGCRASEDEREARGQRVAGRGEDVGDAYRAVGVEVAEELGLG